MFGQDLDNEVNEQKVGDISMLSQAQDVSTVGLKETVKTSGKKDADNNYKSLIGANSLNFVRASILNINRNSVTQFAIAHDHLHELTQWNYEIQKPEILEYNMECRSDVTLSWPVRFFLVSNYYPCIFVLFGVLMNSSVYLMRPLALPFIIAAVGFKLVVYFYVQIRHGLYLRPWLALLSTVPIVPVFRCSRINDHEYSLHRLSLIPVGVKPERIVAQPVVTALGPKIRKPADKSPVKKTINRPGASKRILKQPSGSTAER